MKILVADPDWDFLRKVRQYLEPVGHLVVHEADPDAAISRADHWKPDIVMVNAEMPECADGELLTALESIQPRPAVVLTASLEGFSEAWRAWQRGGDELVIKPVLHPSELHVALIVALKNTVTPRDRAPSAPLAKSA
jgi:CheY-like chemotaxis protein